MSTQDTQHTSYPSVTWCQDLVEKVTNMWTERHKPDEITITSTPGEEGYPATVKVAYGRTANTALEGNGKAVDSDAADKLNNARTLITNLASNDAAPFDGTANNSHGVTGVLGIANGGTGRTDGSVANADHATTADTATSANYATSAGSAGSVSGGVATLSGVAMAGSSESSDAWNSTNMYHGNDNSVLPGGGTWYLIVFNPGNTHQTFSSCTAKALAGGSYFSRTKWGAIAIRVS